MSLPFFVFMSNGDDRPKITHKFRKMGTLGICLIVMGISLAAIYVLWASFGYIGPSFSENVVTKQQSTLRAEYGLPKEPVITDPAILQTPPSLRDSLKSNVTNSTTNV
jgi:hypothetical protein